MLKRLIKLALILVVFFSVILFFQDKIIFFPHPWPAGYELPETFSGLEISAHSFKTHDECQIDALVARPETVINLENAADEHHAKKNGFYILFSHGNAGHLLYRLEKVAVMCRADFNVLIYDYRGFGRSTGSPDVKGAITDGLAALKYLTETLQVPREKIVLYGESLGSGVSAEIMRHSGSDFAGLVLESGFASLGKQANRKFPFIGRHILKADLNVIDAVKSFKGPTLVIHSRADEMIPFADSEEVYAASIATDKIHHIIEQAGHNDPVWENPAYLQTWRDFYALVSKNR